MRLWVGLTLLAALAPVGLSFALTATTAPDDLAKTRASYHRPEAVPYPEGNPWSEAKS